MSKKVVIYVQAYNAEATIHRAIQSILRQTYHEFMCIVCDNGSTDGTWKALLDLQQGDDRICLYHCDMNDTKVLFHTFLPQILTDYQGEFDFFCNLDADDEYMPEFLEKTVKFSEEHNADVVACGSEFVFAQNGEVCGYRMLHSDMVISQALFDEKYTIYHQFCRTLWGKLIRISVLESMDYRRGMAVGYGGDTVTAHEAFLQSEKVGIISDVLHRYYMNEKSVSYAFNKERLTNDSALLECSYSYLFRKCGYVSQKNKAFLNEVFYNAVLDTCSVLLLSSERVEDKVEYLHDIVTNQHFRDICCQEERREFEPIMKLFLAIDRDTFIQRQDKIAEVMAITRMLSWNRAWTEEKEDMLAFLLVLRRYWTKFRIAIDINQKIERLRSQLPVFTNVPIAFFDRYSHLATLILTKQKAEALDLVVDLVEADTKRTTGDTLMLLEVGLNLSAELEYQEVFVYLKKLQIKQYILSDMVTRAQEELEDWKKILPEDEDFIAIEETIEK